MIISHSSYWYRLRSLTKAWAGPFFFVALPLGIASGCAVSTGHNGDYDSEPDAGTGSETDTDTESEPGWEDADSGLSYTKPYLLYKADTLTEETARPLLEFDGEHLAVSWIVEKTAPKYEMWPGVWFFVFPWDKQSSSQSGFYSHEPPACQGFHGWCLSKPYAVDNGFLTLASSGIGPLIDEGVNCHGTEAVWSLNAEILNGPISYWDIYPIDPFVSMSPIGFLDEQGAVTIANLKILLNSLNEYDDYTIVFQIDKFGPQGVHDQILTPIEYPWNTESMFSIHGTDDHLQSQTFSYGGLTTIFSPCSGYDGPPYKYQSIIIAQGSDDGQVTIPPSIFHSPPEKDGYYQSDGAYAFAQREDEIVMVSKIRYEKICRISNA
jgi:hypothetical protein